MQEPFDMTTIIFELLAAFVVWKLRSVLGTRSGTEKPPRNPFATGTPGSFETRRAERGPQPITLPGGAETSVGAAGKDEKWKPYAEPESSAWRGLDSIASADPNFTIQPFAAGAKSAYEMIITAFAEGNREVLRNLLSPEVYAGFAAALDDRERRGQKLSTTFVSIDGLTVDDAVLQGRTAKIKIHFTSEMTTVTRDSNGTVVDGDPDKVVKIDDIWTFARDIRSSDPNWKLCATESVH
jgi:predicted lipid-binding transport protein (Tim44 family)